MRSSRSSCHSKICGGSSTHKNVNVYLETQNPSVCYKDSLYLLCLNALFIIILCKCVCLCGRNQITL